VPDLHDTRVPETDARKWSRFMAWRRFMERVSWVLAYTICTGCSNKS